MTISPPPTPSISFHCSHTPLQKVQDVVRGDCASRRARWRWPRHAALVDNGVAPHRVLHWRCSRQGRLQCAAVCETVVGPTFPGNSRSHMALDAGCTTHKPTSLWDTPSPENTFGALETPFSEHRGQGMGRPPGSGGGAGVRGAALEGEAGHRVVLREPVQPVGYVWESGGAVGGRYKTVASAIGVGWGWSVNDSFLVGWVAPHPLFKRRPGAKAPLTKFVYLTSSSKFQAFY